MLWEIYGPLIMDHKLLFYKLLIYKSSRENFTKIQISAKIDGYSNHTCTDLDPVLLRATFEIPWSNPISTKVARNIAESDIFVRIPGWINDSDWLHAFCYYFL